jgi:septum site-determining protein MinC
MTHRDVVKIKGGRGGLSLIIGEDAQIEAVIDGLRRHIGSSRSFFRGAALRLETSGRSLSPAELERLTEVISELGMVIAADQPETEERQRPRRAARRDGAARPLREEQSAMDEHAEERSVLIKRTLRSGQSISFDGNVIIRGDVNPGAMVVSTGDIIVLGALRGVAHAGATGDEDAVVIAFRLEPTQLRIAGVISRAPDGQGPRPAVPEIARVRDDVIVIEEYRP